MKHEKQVAVIRQMLDRLQTKGFADAGRIAVNSMSVYIDRDLAKREYEEFFHNTPQMIGLSCELEGPGSFITTEDFGIPILAVRDKDGKFRAFLNACRHRGAQVVSERRGKQPRFVCPYHGWAYGSDGSLINVRSADMFGEIDKACNSLIELPAQEKYGMLYIHPDRNGSVDIDAFLGADLVEELVSLELERCIYRDESNYDEPINWKLANDAFCEPYHFSVLHHKTVAALVHGDVTDYEEFGQHHRMTVPSKTIENFADKPESEWNLPSAATSAYYIFPNLHPIFQHNILVFTFIYPDPADPLDPLRCRTRLKLYDCGHIMAGAADVDQDKKLGAENIYDVDVSRPIVLDVAGAKANYENASLNEDYWVGRQVQSAALSGQMENVLYGRNEPGLQHAHMVFRQVLGMPPLETYSEEKQQEAAE